MSDAPSIIKNTPWFFGISVIAIGAFAYFLSWAVHEGIVSQKNATIETLKTQNDAYKEKLNGVVLLRQSQERAKLPQKE